MSDMGWLNGGTPAGRPQRQGSFLDGIAPTAGDSGAPAINPLAEDDDPGVVENVAPEPKLKPKGFFETVGDFGADRVPVLGTAVEFGDLATLLKAAHRVRDGYGTNKDLRMLNAYVAEMERGHTFLGAVADLAGDIPKFAGEFLLSGGAATASKKLAREAANKMLKTTLRAAVASRAAKKTTAVMMKRKGAKMFAKAMATRGGRLAGGVGDVALRVGAMETMSQLTAGMLGMEERGGIITASAARAALGRIDWEQDEFGRFTMAMDAAVPETLDMLGVGFVDSMIQVGSEMVGGQLVGALGKAAKAAGVSHVPLSSKVKALQMTALNRWVSKSGQRSIKSALKAMEKGGWHGILGEFLEERVAGVGELGAEYLLGMQDFDGMASLFPSLRDAAVELAAFSLPSAAISGGVAAQELRIRMRSGLDVGTREAEKAAQNAKLSKDDMEKDPSGGVHLAASHAIGLTLQPQTAVPDLGSRPVRTSEPTYKTETEAELAPEEFEELAQDLAQLGGRARGESNQQQIDIGFGLRGSTNNTTGRALAEDPVTVQGIIDAGVEFMGRAGAGYKVTLGEGRVENLDSRTKRTGRMRDFMEGYNLRSMHARIARARDFQEVGIRFAEMLEANLWRRRRDREGKLVSSVGVYKVNGKAGLSKEARQELVSLGSINLPMRDAKKDHLQAQRGFHEWLRMWLTADGTEYAPATNEWFEDVFKARNPEVYEDLVQLRGMITTFRRQGSAMRFKTQHQDSNAPAARLRHWLKKVSTPLGREELRQKWIEDWVSEDIALRPISRALDAMWRRTRGESLPTHLHPERLAETVRGQAKAMTEQFFMHVPLTWLRKERESVAPLKAIGPLIMGKVTEFSEYLFARRVMAIYEDKPAVVDEDGEVIEVGGSEYSRKTSAEQEPRLGGIGYADAVVMRERYEREYPEFVQAADVIYRWWDSVLDFAADSSPTVAAFVDRMRQRDPGNWAPLHRILGEMEQKTATPLSQIQKALGADVSKSLEGSMREVEDVFREMMKESERIFDLAFTSRVIESIVVHRDIPGIGQFFEVLDPDEVVVANPRVRQVLEKVQEVLDLNAVKTDAEEARELREKPPERPDGPEGASNINLEGMVAGQIARQELDVSDIMNTAVEFMGQLNQPNDMAQTIVPRVNEEGKIEYLDIRDPALMRWFNSGATAEHTGLVFRLMRWHKKMMTLGTTGVRPIFTLFRNPVRDFSTMIINTRTRGPVFRVLVPAWFKIMAYDVMTTAANPIRRAATGKEWSMSDEQRMFHRMGLNYSTELATDSFYARDLAKRLTREKGGRFSMVWDWALETMQSMERASRSTEINLLAKEMQADGKILNNEALTEQAMFDLILAGKQVSTNFTVAGRKGRQWNKYIPFFNAAIQGPRDTMRALFKMGPERQRQKMQRAFMFYTVPGITLWLAVRDEPWYAELSIREKANAWYLPIPGDENHTLIWPLPFEIGIAYSSIPVAFLDQWYREDPDGADWFLGDFINGIEDAAEMVSTTLPSVLPPSVVLAKELLSNEKHFWKTPIVSQSLERLEKQAQYDEYTSDLAKWVGKTAKGFGFKEGLSPKMVDHTIRSIFGSVGGDVAKMFGQDARELDGLLSIPVFGPQFKEVLAHPKTVNELYDAYNDRQRKFDTKIEEESDQERQVRLAMRDAVRAVSALGVILREEDGAERHAFQKVRLSIAKHAMEVHRSGKVDPETRAHLAAERKKYEPSKKEIRNRQSDRRRQALGGGESSETQSSDQ